MLSSDTLPRFASRAGTYFKATGKCANDEVSIGAIVGGVVGGVIGLALIIGVTVGLICFCSKKNAGSSGAPAGVQMIGAAVATPVATAVAMPAAAGKSVLSESQKV